MSYIPRYELRRAYNEEKPIIKRTAKALAKRYNTEARWIEEILNNTLCREKSLLKITTPNRKLKYESDENAILSDGELNSYFMPSIVELLSALGAPRTKSLIKLDTSSYPEIAVSSKGRTAPYDRQLADYEIEALHRVVLNNFLVKILFNVIPPPIQNLMEDDENSDEDDINFSDLLIQFKEHLLSQKEEIINGNGRAYKVFSAYPWFEKAFGTGAYVRTIVLDKGVISLQDSYGKTDRLVKNEKTRRDAESQEQSTLRIEYHEEPKKDFIPSAIPKQNAKENKLLKKALKTSDAQKKESSLREKIFGLRIEAIDLIIQYLDGSLAKEPVDIIVERISDVLSRDEAKAILGENPQYFGLPEGTHYVYAERRFFIRLLRTATFMPSTETTYYRKLMRDTKPIFDYSLDIEGAHDLSFSYLELLNLIKSSEVEQIIATLELVVKRFSAMEKRAYSYLLKALRLEAQNSISAEIKAEVDGYSKQIADRADVVIPYLKEILAPSLDEKENHKCGIFTEGFREYHPRNKKIGIIKFTPLQSKVIEALYEAHETSLNGELKRLTLVDKIYSAEDAKKIRNKQGQRLENKQGVLTKYKYEWRLEKTVLKESHPAWKHGLVRLGNKIGNDKSYKLDLQFEENISKFKY